MLSIKGLYNNFIKNDKLSLRGVTTYIYLKNLSKQGCEYINLSRRGNKNLVSAKVPASAGSPEKDIFCLILSDGTKRKKTTYKEPNGFSNKFVEFRRKIGIFGQDKEIRKIDIMKTKDGKNISINVEHSFPYAKTEERVYLGPSGLAHIKDGEPILKEKPLSNPVTRKHALSLLSSSDEKKDALAGHLFS